MPRCRRVGACWQCPARSAGRVGGLAVAPAPAKSSIRTAPAPAKSPIKTAPAPAKSPIKTAPAPAKSPHLQAGVVQAPARCGVCCQRHAGRHGRLALRQEPQQPPNDGQPQLPLPRPLSGRGGAARRACRGRLLRGRWAPRRGCLACRGRLERHPQVSGQGGEGGGERPACIAAHGGHHVCKQAIQLAAGGERQHQERTSTCTCSSCGWQQLPLTTPARRAAGTCTATRRVPAPRGPGAASEAVRVTSARCCGPGPGACGAAASAAASCCNQLLGSSTSTLLSAVVVPPPVAVALGRATGCRHGCTSAPAGGACMVAL